MLLKLRGGLDSIFVTILLGVLIAAFAIWGVGPGVLSGVNNSVATVGDTEVPAQKYVNLVQRRAQSLQAQVGGQFDTLQLIRMLNLDQQILNQMVAEAAIQEHTSSLGLRVTDERVGTELRGLEAFTLPDGTFSADMMRQVIANNGTTEKELISDLRTAILQADVTGTMTATQPVPFELAEQLFIYQAERRKATMINIAASDMTDIPEATEEQLLAVYDANKGAHMTDELRSYQYIMLTPDMFMDQVELSEDDVLNAYDMRADEFIQPELRDLQQVYFPTEAEANAFIKRVTAGEDFVAVAVELTEFAENELELGELTKADVEVDFSEGAAEEVFSLEAEAVSSASSGLAGWNVFRVMGITPGEDKTLEDVREIIETDAKREFATDLMYDFLPELEDALAADGSLEIVAEKLELTLAQISNVDREGHDADHNPAITTDAGRRILADAYGREIGIEAELTDVDPQDSGAGSYLVELTEVVEPQQKPFEDVRGEISANWQAQQRQLKAGEVAEAAMARLVAGDEAETIAEEVGGTSFNAKNVARTPSENSSLANNIRQLIFSLPKGQTDLEQSADGNGYVIVRVDDVTPGDPVLMAGQVEALYADIQTQLGTELLVQYQNYLLNTLKPTVNTALIEAQFRAPE